MKNKLVGVGCLLTTAIFCFCLGVFVCLPFSLRWIENHPIRPETATELVQDNDENWAYSGSAPVDQIQAYAAQIEYGTKIIQKYPKDKRGYELAIDGFLHLDSSASAAQVRATANRNGIILGSDSQIQAHVPSAPDSGSS